MNQEFEQPINNPDQSIEQQKGIVLSYLKKEKNNIYNKAKELTDSSKLISDKQVLLDMNEQLKVLLVIYNKIKSNIKSIEENSITKQELQQIIQEYNIDTTIQPNQIIQETYIDKDSKQEKQIEINIEQQLEYWTNFYKENKVDWITLPDSIQLQEQQITEMKRLIKEYGFDKLLIIPENIVGQAQVKDKKLIKKAENYSKLHELMTKEYNESSQGDNFKQDESFDGISDNSTKLRLILTKDIQELYDDKLFKDTLGKSPDKLKEQFIDKLNLQSLSVSEYLIYQREYFSRNKKHLDEEKAVWLLNSKMPTWSPVPYSRWNTDYSRLHFYSGEASGSAGHGGSRLSGSFEVI